MKITVESTQLKTLLTEEAYISGFSKIQGGDMFIVVTDKKTYNGKVVDKYATQIIVQIEGRNYIVTNNSLDDDELRSNEVIQGKKQPASITKGVKTIIIRRNGNTITTLIPSNGRFDGDTGVSGKKTKEKPKEPFIKPFYKNAYNEVLSVLKSVEENNKLVIKSGQLITPNDIGSESITTFTIHVRKIFKDDIIMAAVTDIVGDGANEFEFLKDEPFIKISISESLELTENGVTLMFKTYKGNEAHIIEGVFEMHVGEFFNIKEPTFDDMMQDKGFRDLMLKNPNLMGRISGEMAKGVIPASEILKDLGLNKGYYTRGKKVKFTYTGQAIRPKQVLSLASGKEYIGIFSTNKSIRLSSEKKGESLLIKLKRKTHEQTYEVEVFFNKLKNGQQDSISVGRGIIQITDINFR